MTASVPADPVIPVWLRRTGAVSWRLLVIVALAAVTIWVAVVLGTVTVSILLALVVAASFAPMVRRLRARGWSATAASAAVTALTMLIAVGGALLLALTLIPDLADLVTAIRAGLEELRAQLEAASIPPVIGLRLEAAANAVRSWIESGLGDVVGAIASVVTVAILTLFLTFFVLVDGEKAWVWLLQITTDAKRERIDASGRDALDRVGGYLRGTAILSGARAGLYAAFLWILGVPEVVPLALITLFGGFIPYIGPFIAMAAVLLVALGTVGPQLTLVLLVLMLIANGVVNNFLRPMVYGRSVNLHPAVILVAIPAGAAIAGIIGVFAAVPATAFAVAIGGAIVAALEPDTQPEPDRMVAGWIDRLAQWSWRLLAALGVIGVAILVIAQAPLVVIPIVLALIIAASVAPIARVLRKRGWSNGRSAMAATGGTFLLIVALIAIAVIQIAGPIGEAVLAAIESSAALEDDAGGALGWVDDAAQAFGGNLLAAIGTVLELIAALLVVLLLSALLSFYFLRDGGRGWDLVVKRASAWRREALTDAGRDGIGILGGYMLGTAAISAVGAISQYVIMVLFGLPFAFPIAILSFILGFIPYYGGFITTGIAFLVAVGYGTPTQIALMFVWTIVFNLVQGNIVTPLVYRRAVNLHPAVVLLAIPAGGAVAGVAGMFLAVPILAVIAATWRTVLYVLGDRPTASQPIPASADEVGGAEPTVDVSLGAPAK